MVLKVLFASIFYLTLMNNTKVICFEVKKCHQMHLKFNTFKTLSELENAKYGLASVACSSHNMHLTSCELYEEILRYVDGFLCLARY